MVTRRMLEGMSYVESALWIVSCLADGLSHAHERGILHRDLKPANVLITDEGQPLLLDFNLSEDVARPEGQGAAAVGGTLPYMSPEHLDAFRGATRPPDARGDVYSLGVILYELLTGRCPFASPAGPTLADAVARMIEERLGPPPDPRLRNPAVTPAVASIVRRCLEPVLDQRYQSADELREDLRRQLEHRPLRHAPDPSPRERVRKWARRHPRLASSNTLGVVATTIILSLAGGLGLGVHWAGARERAHEAFARFERGLHEARSALYTSGVDGPRRRQGMAACLRALEDYPIGGGRGWRAADLVRHLDPADRARLSEGRGEALWLLAQATWLEAAEGPGGDAGEGARRALALNLEAEDCYPADGVPAALLTQRAELLRRLGRPDEARRWGELASATPARTPRDYYLAAAEQVLMGRFESAASQLETATRLAPGLSWAWFLRGVCHDRLGQDVDALACYQACLALSPDDSWVPFNRGLVHLRRGEPGRALADFDWSLRLDPGRVEPILDRALALHDLGRHAESIRALDLALELGASPARALFMRARVREDAGDAEGAARDRARGMAFRPEDGPGWIARGLARAASDPEAALADFGEALRLDPASLAALQNSAHVLCGLAGRSEEAVEALGRALEVAPDYVPARSGRGVLLARMGRRGEALRDAEEALARDASPSVVYQVAGIYAQTSRQSPEDARIALELLARALRGGAGWELLDADPDLGPIRDHPDFERLIRAAPALAAGRAAEAGQTPEEAR
jgi:tetratricopeptide (TPR) repeat protein